MIGSAFLYPRPLVFAVSLILGLLSDIFDGKVARRLGVATAKLRRLDSAVDTVFYSSAALCVYLLHEEFILKNLGLLIVLLALEILRYLFDWYKFRKEASYHMWSAKFWGLILFACFFGILVSDSENQIFTTALWVGIISDLEGLLISIILPNWQCDVPTFWHALKLRDQSTTP